MYEKKYLKILTATSIYKYGKFKAVRTSYKFKKKIVDPYITMAHYSNGFPEKSTKHNNGEAILFEDLYWRFTLIPTCFSFAYRFYLTSSGTV